MAADDQDAAVGHLVRERRELRTRQQELSADGAKMGELLIRVGQALVALGGPQTKRFSVDIGSDEVSVAMPSADGASTRHGRFPRAEEIRQLLTDLQEIESRLASIEVELKPFD